MTFIILVNVYFELRYLTIITFIDDGYSSEFTASPVDQQEGEIVILYDSEADYWTTEATTSASANNNFR